MLSQQSTASTQHMPPLGWQPRSGSMPMRVASSACALGPRLMPAPAYCTPAYCNPHCCKSSLLQIARRPSVMLPSLLLPSLLLPELLLPSLLLHRLLLPILLLPSLLHASPQPTTHGLLHPCCRL